MKMNENTNKELTGLEIAVIGMSCRFPGARNVDRFRDNITDGIDSISFFSAEELEESGIDPGIVRNPYFIKAKGIIDSAEYFDAAFFGYSAKEAEVMDPQARVLHECIWEALENAGYNPFTYPGLIGLFSGAAPHAIWDFISFPPVLGSPSKQFADSQLSDKDFMTTKIAYKLNLRGPILTLFTACSTSLAAVHWACSSVLSGECDMALAGGVSITLPVKMGYFYEEGMIFSSDGRHRSFDQNATGSVFGDGAGVVLLKRLDDAIKDRDTIHAVIKGSAVNNDGNRKLGYTAPSVEGQAEVIRAALQMAQVDASTIDYIETHGSATPLGDVMEIEALARVFGKAGEQRKKTKKEGIALGSVKTNVGHLNTAAGIAGFIKAVLMVKYGIMPPHLHFETPNPEIDFESTPFYINTGLKEWKNETRSHPFRVGVSSFGIGGTNAHVILEEPSEPFYKPSRMDGVPTPPKIFIKNDSREFKLLVLSAKTPASLDCAAKSLLDYLKENAAVNLSDAAYTLAVGRRHFQYRKAWVCSTVDEAVAVLSSPGSEKVFTFNAGERAHELHELNELKELSINNFRDPGTAIKPHVVWMFPGIGAQYEGMGEDLYTKERVFKEEMDRCIEILKSIKGDATPSEQSKLFIFEYCLAKLLISWGIVPSAVIGYSFGEYAAACISGVMTLEEALGLVILRERLMAGLPKGAMTSVPLSFQELKPLIAVGSGLGIAVDNGPSCIVGGSLDAVEVFEGEMKDRGILCIRVNVPHAVHSPEMVSILPLFEDAVKKIELKGPRIPYISSITGERAGVGEVESAGYWVSRLVGCVHFGAGLNNLLKDQGSVLVEVGPGRDLSILARGQANFNPSSRVVHLVRDKNEKEKGKEKDVIDDSGFLLKKIGRLWEYGVEIDWQRFYADEKRYRVPLPTTHFEGQYFPGDADYLKKREKRGQARNFMESDQPMSVARFHGSSIKPHRVGLWVPQWKRSPIPFSPGSDFFHGSKPGHILVSMDRCGVGERVAAAMRQQGFKVSVVFPGETFSRLDEKENEFTLNPADANDYEALFREMKEEGDGGLPGIILHLWSLTSTAGDSGGAKAREKQARFEEVEVEKNLEMGFYSLEALAQALGKQNPPCYTQVKVVSNNTADVTGEEIIFPGKAAVLGPVVVIPEEYDHLRCCLIDIVPGDFNENAEEGSMEQWITEMKMDIRETRVAYRHGYRWVQSFEPLCSGAESDQPMNIAGFHGSTIKPHRVGEKGDRQEKGDSQETPRRGAESGQALYIARNHGTAIKPHRVGEKGIYLITGGLGGIGLKVAEYLAENYHVKLILTGRRAEEQIKTGDVDLKRLETLGAEVMAVSADVSDFMQMKRVVEQAEERFGRINGVVHAAGVPDGALIYRRTRQMSGDVFSAKIGGALVLEKLFRDAALDFFVLCSSIASIVGAPGQAAYAGANAFLDALASCRFLKNKRTPISINWDRWRNTGIAKIAEAKHREITGEDMQGGLSVEEGINGFAGVLVLGLTRAVVTHRDLKHIHTISSLSSFLQKKDLPSDKFSSLSPFLEKEPSMETGEVSRGEYRNDWERKVAGVMQEILGIERIGVDDNFFDLNATSLQMIQAASALKSRLQIDIPVITLFNYPTIGQLAAFLEQIRISGFEKGNAL